jgi:ferritin-like metal-binding protein YciE
MSINTTAEKFLHELGDIYDAEHRFLEAQQQLLALITNETLRAAIEQHTDETQQQIRNLGQIFVLLGASPQRESCDAAQGLISEAQKSVQNAGNVSVRDCLILSSLLKVEHYEMASYRNLVIGAQYVDNGEVKLLLQEIQQQEEDTAHKLEMAAPLLIEKAMQNEVAPVK